MNGRKRNEPCPCGSGIKLKKCLCWEPVVDPQRELKTLVKDAPSPEFTAFIEDLVRQMFKSLK